MMIRDVGTTVDNASLTGESEPIKRNSEESQEANLLEANNMAFFGTQVPEAAACAPAAPAQAFGTAGVAFVHLYAEASEPSAAAVLASSPLSAPCPSSTSRHS